MSSDFLADVHAHLQDAKFARETGQIIQNALDAGVKRIINAGTCIESSRQAILLAEQYDCCFSLIGIHPHDAKTFNNTSVDELKLLAAHRSALGIGEIGLDYHYDFSPRDQQRHVFSTLWTLAAELKMPAIIHVREAFDDFFKLIKDLPQPESVMLHCFSGNLEIAKQAADLGFHFSIGGALTFPKSESTREVFSWLPLDVIHLETDCPYLAPQPKRGKRNEPAYLVHTFDFLARLRDIDANALKSTLRANLQSFFGPKMA